MGIIAQPPGFDLAQLPIINATPTGLCCVFGNQFLLRYRPAGAYLSVKKWSNTN